MYTSRFLYPCICQQTLDCFHTLATVNSAAVNTGLQVSVQDTAVTGGSTELPQNAGGGWICSVGRSDLADRSPALCERTKGSTQCKVSL